MCDPAQSDEADSFWRCLRRIRAVVAYFRAGLEESRSRAGTAVTSLRLTLSTRAHAQQGTGTRRTPAGRRRERLREGEGYRYGVPSRPRLGSRPSAGRPREGLPTLWRLPATAMAMAAYRRYGGSTLWRLGSARGSRDDGGSRDGSLPTLWRLGLTMAAWRLGSATAGGRCTCGPAPGPACGRRC